MNTPSNPFVSIDNAAFISNASTAELKRIIDDFVIPSSLVDYSPDSKISQLGTAFAIFYFYDDGIFTRNFKQDVISDVVDILQREGKLEQALSIEGDDTKPFSLEVYNFKITIRGHNIAINLQQHIDTARNRLRELNLALTQITVDPDIMEGNPIFQGTRIPIDIVLTSIEKNIPFNRIRESYPFLTPELIRAAATYNQLRKRHTISHFPGWK